MKRNLFLFIFLFSLNSFSQEILLNSDNFEDVPHATFLRGCCGFGYNLGLTYIPMASWYNIIDFDQLAEEHEYGGSFSEENGQIYTCKAGFIDSAHVREVGDWTSYLAHKIYYALKQGGKTRIALRPEGTKETYLFLRPFKGTVTKELAIALAQRISFELSLWHEISSWYGYTSVPIYSQRHSAFSPEDLYSNMLGTFVAKEVLMKSGDYNETFNQVLREKIKALGPLSRKGTETAFDMVEGKNKWWDKNHVVTPDFFLVRKRNLDYFEESLRPWKVPRRVKGCKKNSYSLSTLQLPNKVNNINLKERYVLVFDIDRDDIPIPMPVGREDQSTINSFYFPRLLEHLRGLVKEELGQDALSPFYMD